MFFKHLRWAVLWALLILILCGIPGRDIPHISFLELLSFDKFVHAGIFFVLFLLTAKGFAEQTTSDLLKRTPRLAALFIGVVYGGLLEVMQGSLFEERSADVYDFIANSFGCVVAALLYDRIQKKGLMRFIK